MNYNPISERKVGFGALTKNTDKYRKTGVDYLGIINSSEAN